MYYSLENKNEGRYMFGNGMNFYCIFSESPQAMNSLRPSIGSPRLSESTRCSHQRFNSFSSLCERLIINCVVVDPKLVSLMLICFSKSPKCAVF